MENLCYYWNAWIKISLIITLISISYMNTVWKEHSVGYSCSPDNISIAMITLPFLLSFEFMSWRDVSDQNLCNSLDWNQK